MSRRYCLILIGLLLAGSLWIIPIKSTLAQGEEPAETLQIEEESGEETGSARGPGAVIILVGLATILIVGATYLSRQSSASGTN